MLNLFYGNDMLLEKFTFFLQSACYLPFWAGLNLYNENRVLAAGRIFSDRMYRIFSYTDRNTVVVFSVVIQYNQKSKRTKPHSCTYRETSKAFTLDPGSKFLPEEQKSPLGRDNDHHSNIACGWVVTKVRHAAVMNSQQTTLNVQKKYNYTVGCMTFECHKKFSKIQYKDVYASLIQKCGTSNR